MSEPVWHYTMKCREGKDHRKGDARRLVTLETDDMTWVGIRAWHDNESCWYNGNEPESASIKAWAYLPEPATGFWDRGNLTITPYDDRHPEESP